jgi:hypothetical protein
MTLEWLILADAAEVIGNRLYLMGGGLERAKIHTQLPVAQHMGIAVALRLSSQELGQTHEFVLDIQSPQGKWLASFEADFEVKATSKEATADEMRWQFATSVDLSLDAVGKYLVLVFINGQEMGRQSFEVVMA